MAVNAYNRKKRMVRGEALKDLKIRKECRVPPEAGNDKTLPWSPQWEPALNFSPGNTGLGLLTPHNHKKGHLGCFSNQGVCGILLHQI